MLLCFLKPVFWKAVLFSERMLCFDLQGHRGYRRWASHGAQLLSGNLSAGADRSRRPKLWENVEDEGSVKGTSVSADWAQGKRKRQTMRADKEHGLLWHLYQFEHTLTQGALMEPNLLHDWLKPVGKHHPCRNVQKLHQTTLSLLSYAALMHMHSSTTYALCLLLSVNL